MPPFLLFDKPGTGRDVRFRGLLAAGSGLPGSGEDLIAIWRTARGQRFHPRSVNLPGPRNPSELVS